MRRRVAAVPAVVTVVTAVVASLAACGDGSPDARSSSAATSAASVPSSGATTSAPTSSAATTPPAASATAPTSTGPSATATRMRTATARPSAATSLAPVPRAGAEPRVRFPDNPPAVGRGANADVAAVPDRVWARMVGTSWTSGCPVGRSQLRYVTVNFWGFDGERSRGALVVNRSVASAAAAAFTDLYQQRFRIRQMRPMDSTWGKNPKGPGADDYAAMEADNTSAFNCRYVGGQEARQVWSRHAYGTAIDVNDLENPYVDDDGRVYPDPYFLHRRSARPGVFSSSSSAAVRAFTDRGLTWGGRWSHPDYQHFEGR